MNIQLQTQTQTDLCRVMASELLSCECLSVPSSPSPGSVPSMCWGRWSIIAFIVHIGILPLFLIRTNANEVCPDPAKKKKQLLVCHDKHGQQEKIG